MPNQFDKVGDGTSELARNFERDSVRIALDLSHRSGWFSGCVQPGDLALDWYVQAPSEFFKGDGDVSIYQGSALVRDGKVHFYDRYPRGGGPFRVSDFTGLEFRKRAELISENIERLLRE